MAFCKNCGAQLEDGAKFCPNCGTPAGATGGTTSETRKQVFVNSVIRKCPHCGAEISSDTMKCPECGFLLERENVNSNLDDFIKKITDINRARPKNDGSERSEKALWRYEEEMPEKIRMALSEFALPNKKEDIIAFLTFALGQAEANYTGDIFIFPGSLDSLWVAKCREILNQAKVVFYDDSSFLERLSLLESEINKKEKIENSKKANSNILSVVGFIFGFLIIAGFVLLVKSCIS